MEFSFRVTVEVDTDEEDIDYKTETAIETEIKVALEAAEPGEVDVNNKTYDIDLWRVELN